MQNKITPFFWFDKNMDEILEYYKNIFNSDAEENFKVESINKISDTQSVVVEIVVVNLFGNIYQFMTAGPYFKFSEAISLVINTEDQEETDKYWDYFTKEGSESQCGWCKDRYGLSWQIVPKQLSELTASKDIEIAKYATEQMLKMKKIIIKDLFE